MVTQAQQVTYAKREAKSISWQHRLIQIGFQTLGTVAPSLTGRLAFKMMLSPRRFPLSAKNQAFLDGAQQIRIPYLSGDLAGYVWGDVWGRSKTILLVHGWEANASQFRVLAGQLARQGYRVVAFDAPAHGQNPGTMTNILDAGEALRTVMRHCGPVHGIVAHSFGAAYTLYLLGTHPELRVERLVLNGAPASVANVIQMFAQAVGLPSRVVNVLHDLTRRRISRPVSELSASDVAPNVTIPSLVLHDQQDEMVPFSNAEDITSGWPGAEFVPTTGLGHRGALRDPETLRRIIDFLD